VNNQNGGGRVGGKGWEWVQKGMRREGTGIGRDEYEGM